MRLARAVYDEVALLVTGWVTEGDSAFGEMSGSTPKSIHQQALRGIAKVLMEVRRLPCPTPALPSAAPVSGVTIRGDSRWLVAGTKLQGCRSLRHRPICCCALQILALQHNVPAGTACTYLF